MRIFAILFSVFYLCSTKAQQKEAYHYNSVFLSADLIRAQHFRNPDKNPERDTRGLAVEFSSQLAQNSVFHLNARYGYRYISNYLEAEEYYNGGQFVPEGSPKDYDFHGGWMGLGLSIGHKSHFWENSFFVGIGRMNGLEASFNNRHDKMIGFETGYKYVSSCGFSFRIGHRKNAGRNEFESQVKSLYLGFGYTIRANTPEKIEVKNKKKRPSYKMVFGGPFIGSLEGELAGINLRTDYLFLRSSKLDFGIGISGQLGAPYDSDTRVSLAAYALLLYGQSEGKLEILLGPSYSFVPDYEIVIPVHAGIGYRYVSDTKPLSVRFGIATKSILYAGIGFRVF